MTPQFLPGHLKLAVMGELLRNPAANTRDVAAKLECEDVAVVRVTLSRLQRQGLVREIDVASYMLTRAGMDHLASVRRMVSA